MAFHAEHKTTRMDGDAVGPAVRGNLPAARSRE
jgi:hypothetical protein